MLGLKLRLNNGDCITATYRQVRESRLLEGVVPADEEEERINDASLPIDLSADDWKLYCDFAAAVVAVESQTKQKLVPNFGFAQDYFKDTPEETIIQLKRVGRYLDCKSIEENIKYYIGGMYSHYTIDEFLQLVGITDRTDGTFEKVSKEVKQKHSQALVQKLKQRVPELKDLPVTFDH